MKKLFYTTVLWSLFFSVNFAYSQSFSLGRAIKNTSWTFGLSGHIVVDGGKETSFPFNTKAWNYLPFPSRISIDGHISRGWSLQGEIAYTEYKKGAIVDGLPIVAKGLYIGADLNAKFSLATLTKIKNGWFDPYLTVGYGYTLRNVPFVTHLDGYIANKHTGNNNLGIGCNFWFYKGFGLNLQGLGKFVMKGGERSNYTHYSAAIVYRILSKKQKLGN